jgi:uncharacterized protein
VELLALVCLVLFGVVGFAAIFFTTFGTGIILLGMLLYAFLTEFSAFPIETLSLLVGLYLAGEAFEWLFTILGAKRMGASNAAVVGALIGGMAGAMLGFSVFGIGLFWGTLAGLFSGAFLVELVIKKDWRKSVLAGIGGVLGRLGAIFAKVVIALLMFAVVALQLLK